MLPLEDSWTLMLVNRRAELKLMDKRDGKTPYVGANLQSSRTPSAIDNHCQSSYQIAKRKLHSSRAKVRFYVAGENNHSAIYAVSPQRFSSFDSLLGSLTKTPICNKENSEKERYIFSLDGSHKITSLDELHSGESYVCATYEVFEQLSEERERPASSHNRYKTLQTAALAAARPTHTSQSTRSRHSIALDGDQHIKSQQSEEQQFLTEIKPRLITVLRGGMRPRKSVRILLNKKNTRSFEQIIGGIGDILCPDEQVKRLFGISGRLVMCLADFYLDDSVFFAYCNDKMHPDDLVLDRSEVRCVGAYRFRRASAYGRVTLTSHQKGVVNERPRSIPASTLADVYRLSSETRGSSRAKSCRPSIPSSPVREKQSIELMEKESRSLFNVTPVLDKSDPGRSPPPSIHTLTPRSDKSKESIDLSPSSPAAKRDTASPVKSFRNDDQPSIPPSPTKTETSRKSPSRKPHPSGASFSRKSSRVSNLGHQSTPPQSPSKHDVNYFADDSSSKDHEEDDTLVLNNKPNVLDKTRPSSTLNEHKQSSLEMPEASDNAEELDDAHNKNDSLHEAGHPKSVSPIQKQSTDENLEHRSQSKTNSTEKETQLTNDKEHHSASRKSSASSECYDIKDNLTTNADTNTSVIEEKRDKRRSKGDSESDSHHSKEDRDSYKSEERKSAHSGTTKHSDKDIKSTSGQSEDQKGSDQSEEQVKSEDKPDEVKSPTYHLETEESKSGVDEDEYSVDFEESPSDPDEENDLLKLSEKKHEAP